MNYGSAEKVSSCSHTQIKVTEGFSFDRIGAWVPFVFIVCRHCDRTIAQYKKPKDGVPSLDELSLKLAYLFNFNKDADKYDVDVAHDLK